MTDHMIPSEATTAGAIRESCEERCPKCGHLHMGGADTEHCIESQLFNAEGEIGDLKRERRNLRRQLAAAQERERELRDLLIRERERAEQAEQDADLNAEQASCLESELQDAQERERAEKTERVLADHGPEGHNVTNAQYAAVVEAARLYINARDAEIGHNREAAIAGLRPDPKMRVPVVNAESALRAALAASPKNPVAAVVEAAAPFVRFMDTLLAYFADVGDSMVVLGGVDAPVTMADVRAFRKALAALDGDGDAS